MEEIEVKFLNIDVEKTEKKLQEIGAKKVFERMYKRQTFDYPGLVMDKKGAWLRLRDEGDKITLAFKRRLGIETEGDDDGMEEIEIEVSDFENAKELLLNIGLKKKGYQENKRIRYILDDIEFDIDFWPKLEPFLEIEASSWKRVQEGVKLLGFDYSKKRIFSAQQIYREQGIDVNDYSEVTFEKMIKRSEKI